MQFIFYLQGVPPHLVTNHHFNTWWYFGCWFFWHLEVRFLVYFFFQDVCLGSAAWTMWTLLQYWRRLRRNFGLNLPYSIRRRRLSRFLLWLIWSPLRWNFGYPAWPPPVSSRIRETILLLQCFEKRAFNSTEFNFSLDVLFASDYSTALSRFSVFVIQTLPCGCPKRSRDLR